MAEHGGKAPPKKGAEKKSGGGFWSFLGDALRSVSVDVDHGAPGRPAAPSRNPTDPASRMEPVRAEREEAYQETIYRKTEGGDGIAPAVRIDRDRRAIARSLDNRMGAQAETKVPDGGGSPLAHDVRAKMEPRLGGDLSNVRVHTGSESAQAAKGFGARAFTVGSDVHFNAGEHAPGTKEGDRLLAHELTHVVQGQRSGIQRKAEHEGDGDEGAQEAHGGHDVSQPNEPAEQEADHVADKVADNLHGDKKKEGGGEHGDEKQAGGADAKGGHGGGDVKEAAAPISAKLHSVGRKIFRKPPKGAGKSADKKSGDKSGPNPNFEKDALAFETKVGPLAYGKGAGVGPTLMAKVRAYIEAKCESPVMGPIDKLKDELAKLTSGPDMAGGVVAPEDIKQLLMTKDELAQARTSVEAFKNVKDGNLREQMTVVANFGNVMNSDLMSSSGPDAAKIQGWIAQAGLSKVEVDKRLEHAKAAKEKKGKADWGDQPGGHIPPGKTEKQKQHAGAIGDQSNARLAKNPKDGDKRRADRSKQGKPDDPTQTQLTAGQMDAQGMPLSDREERAQGNPEKTVPLKWSEGIKTWMVDKEHKWVQAQKKLGVPLGAGPSGTTNLIMNTGLILGADAQSLRMACIGYLLPIHAHSLVEILTAAAAHGAAFSPGPQMYRRLPPLSEDELRGCGRPGGQGGKNLFPDERDPNEK